MKRIVSEALLVRSVDYGESDLIVTLLTRTDGKVSALVRGGRRGSRRLGGALEPFHTMQVTIDDRGGELGALREASIAQVRATLVTNLDAVEAAGTCLRWARHLFPARTPEPEGWLTLLGLLDALDKGATPRPELAAAGLALLAHGGYALDFERCVRCGKACPETRPSAADPARGGLVCQACGGSKHVIAAEVRAGARALARGERGVTRAVADALVTLAEGAMAAHAGYGGL